MTLIKSISGIRGTIGGVVGENLTPVDIVKFTSAYALFIKNSTGNPRPRVVVGRDARISGSMIPVCMGVYIAMQPIMQKHRYSMKNICRVRRLIP